MYHKSIDDTERIELLNKVKDLNINQWLLANGNLCGLNFNLNSLANFLGCEPGYIQIFMRDRLLSSRIWDESKQGELINAMLGQQMAWVLEDRMDIQNQVDILKMSQGGRYQAFISSELNKALKLKLESSTSLQSVIRNLSGGNVTNFFAQINQNHIEEGKGVEGITFDEALEVITGVLKEVPQLATGDLEYLEEKYNVKELPEVVATKQDGFHNVDKEGLNIRKAELNQITDNYKANLTEDAEADFKKITDAIEGKISNSRHDRRRSKLLGEPEDVEDPELE